MVWSCIEHFCLWCWRFINSPVSWKFYFGKSITSLTVTFLVDSNVFAFFSAARTVIFLFDVCWEGRVAIFPSDALAVNLCFYLCRGSLVYFFVAVRRREDAKGHGNSGVKVQVDWLEGRPVSCWPFELSGNKSKGNKKRPLASLIEGN